MTRAFEYIDGGRSRAVRRSLERSLRGIREELGADVALAVHREISGTNTVCILASSLNSGLQLPLPNEPMLVNCDSLPRRPSSANDLVLRSTVRRFYMELVSALVVPWTHVGGYGWLIVGITPRAWNDGSLDVTTATGYAAKLRDTHRVAGLRGSARLRRDIVRSAQRLAESEITSRSVGDFLHSTVIAARELLCTSACYVSLPGDDGLTFTFSTFIDVHTSAFRRLRMGPGQGLGGLARQELRPVRSVNYAGDHRLHDAPVRETMNEGFLSAMCAPLIAEGQLIGLLYAANRNLTPFTETDSALLQEFSGYATLGLKQAQIEEHRHTVMRRQERERLAGELHDSVVRYLMEIGLESEAGAGASADPSAKRHFDAISHAAQSCLELVRERIADMTAIGTDVDARPVEEVLQTLKLTGSRRRLRRSFSVEGDARVQRGLPHNVASALISSGQEALQNADLHSGGTQIDVTLVFEGEQVKLRISDDGRGVNPDALPRLLESPDHLGIRRMRTATQDAGGTLRVGKGEGGGLCVEVVVPLAGSERFDAGD